ncbi:hypothetical protein SAMN06265360_11228 [Haloechinothrix alba]|uniref:Uncharacterized protein n=1 Tax=Haloechinothrix alba TaxID=664784 RepID=A0A238XSL9_9PSEU|nr:hypothetical protein SAMN06265360_11228 [Haloechinothrix alba]
MLTEQQQSVQTYTDGFATGDGAQIVSCVNDDLVWEFNGPKTSVLYQSQGAQPSGLPPIPTISSRSGGRS